jgi:hypothetical protein
MKYSINRKLVKGPLGGPPHNATPATDQCANPRRPRTHPLERRRPRPPLGGERHHGSSCRTDAEHHCAHPANDQAIRRALEQAGVEFIDDEKGGPGVRLRGAPAVK